MIDLEVTTTIKLEFKNFEIVSKVENICTELSITPEEFIIKAISKLLKDVHFVRELRNYNIIQKWF